MRFFQRKCDLGLHIRTTPRRLGARATGAEERLKEIAEPTRSVRSGPSAKDLVEVKAAACRPQIRPIRWKLEFGAPLPFLPKPVVTPALVRIGQDLVGLVQFFEFLFGRLIDGIDIRVVSARELSIRLLDFTGGG